MSIYTLNLGLTPNLFLPRFPHLSHSKHPPIHHSSNHGNYFICFYAISYFPTLSLEPLPFKCHSSLSILSLHTLFSINHTLLHFQLALPASLSPFLLTSSLTPTHIFHINSTANSNLCPQFAITTLASDLNLPYLQKKKQQKNIEWSQLDCICS